MNADFGLSHNTTYVVNSEPEFNLVFRAVEQIMLNALGKSLLMYFWSIKRQLTWSDVVLQNIAQFQVFTCT